LGYSWSGEVQNHHEHLLQKYKHFNEGAHAVILVYDITNKESFESIQNFWLDEVENYADPGTLLVLVGNKSDARDSQQVDTETARQFAKEKNMLFFETSAKTAEHVLQRIYLGQRILHGDDCRIGKETR
jgi:small GTP-binding protein